MNRFLFLLFLLMPNVLVAGACDWATDNQDADATYRYFTARESGDSMSDAQAKAEQDINYQISRLFGSVFQSSTSLYEDEGSSNITIRAEEKTLGNIVLKGLDKTKSNTEKYSGGYIACVRYRYSKKELAAEQARLNKIASGAISGIKFTETAGDRDCAGAPVKIITTPAGADVYIGGKIRGETPLSIGNVCRGAHKLRITKEDYDDVDEQLIIPLANETISKTLKRGTKKISISTNLGNAIIKVGGVRLGKEPQTYNVKLGEEITIEAEHTEAFSVSQQIKASKGDAKSDYKLSLEKKPAKLDFASWKRQNAGWLVAVDGREVKDALPLDADKTYDLTFTKSGFRRVTDSVRLKGGETLYYDKKYNFIPVKSDVIGDDLELTLFSGIGAAHNSLTLDAAVSSGVGLFVEPLTLRLRKDAFYARLGAGFNVGGIDTQYDGTNIAPALDLSLSLGFNLGSSFSVFGIINGQFMKIDRPESSTGKNLSGTTNFTMHGIGIEYNIPQMPITLRFTYTTGTADLWNDFWLGRENTRLNAMRFSINLNWGKVADLIEEGK